MEFLDYFKALRCSPRPKSQPVAFAVAGYVLIFAGVFLGGMAGWLPTLASIAFAATLCIGYWCANTPNYETSFPVNHKKKLLYRFLSSVVMFLLLIAILIAAFLVVALIATIFVSITSGGLGWVSEDETISDVNVGESIFGYVGLYGGLYGLAYFIILYSSGMIAGFIKKRKIRNIFLTCLCAGILLSWLIMCLPYSVEAGTIIGASPFKASCYTAMGVPWISTVFWMLVAAGSLGASIYLGIKHYDPKKF